jgi:hypothetical protein
MNDVHERKAALPTYRKLVINGTVSIPFRIVDRVDTRRHDDGSGDLAIAIAGSDRIPYLSLWPYARPWRVQHPEPMLRAVSDFDALASTLREALAGFGSTASPATRARSAASRAIR